MTRLAVVSGLAFAACAGREPDHATVWIGDGQTPVPVLVASSTTTVEDDTPADASPPLEVGERPPEGIYAITVEPVSDSCNPKRPTYDAGLQPLTGSRTTGLTDAGALGAQYWLVIPYPTSGRNHIRSMRMMSAGTVAMPYPFFSGCTSPSTRVDRTFDYEGPKGDSFTILAREYWPDTAGCPQGPEDVPNPVKACKSERRVRYRLVSACNAPCKQQIDSTLYPTADGGKLTGVQKRGENTIALVGVRAPELKRKAPKAWTNPEPLFDGKSLAGWEPLGNPANSHWVVKDGLLVNEEHGANLKTTRTFDDFRLHFEVNCPEHGNSGFYLRGRYEVQIEYEPLTDNPAERRIGSIYGRIAPKVELPRTPGQWETFDITLVGRTLTVVRNGVTIIDRREIEGITGGALDANEGEPGPFYIQGDHTGGLKFRNITIAAAKR